MARVVDLNDVGMLERGGNARLVKKHIEELFALGKLRQDPLDHHLLLKTANAAYLCQVNFGHSTDGELLLKLIPSEEGLVDFRAGHARCLIQRDLPT